jgi:predicted  nucleic acid-binding Zn-ribbon protein
MSQYNLKNEVDLNNQNLDNISPRLASALEKLHTAIDELKKNRDLYNHMAKDTTDMKDEIEKLNDENIGLLHKLEELKQKNSKLTGANQEVETRISSMIKTYRNFLK